MLVCVGKSSLISEEKRDKERKEHSSFEIQHLSEFDREIIENASFYPDIVRHPNQKQAHIMKSLSEKCI